MPEQPKETQSLLTKFLLSVAIAAGTAAVLAACEETQRQLSRAARATAAPRLPRTRKSIPSKP